MRVDERREGVALGREEAKRGYPKKKKKNGNDTISRPVIKGRFLPEYEYEHDRSD